MIREFGERYDRKLEYEHFSNPDVDPKPRLRRPWPVLKVPKAKREDGSKKVASDPPLGYIDEGSDHDDNYPWDVVLGDSDNEDATEAIPGDKMLIRIGGRKTRSRVTSPTPVEPEYKIVNELPPWLPYVPLLTPWWGSVYKILSSTSVKPRRLRFVVKRPSRILSPTRGRQSSKKPSSTQDNGEEADVEDIQPTLPLITNRRSDLYEVKGIPVLQENIPEAYFPDNLLVHDPLDLSMGVVTPNSLHDDVPSTPAPVLYERLWPPSDPFVDAKLKRNIAQLYLSPNNEAGTGHHSVVYAAPFRLPPPLTTYNSASSRPGTVRVMAKVALQNRLARELLDNEGEIYNSFPQHLSEEYCGLHLLTPEMTSLVPSAAVTPKFFGYYIPIEGQETRDTPTWEHRSPILLVEDCGEPISASQMCYEDRYESSSDALVYVLTRPIRIECYSLLIRLHFAEYMHNSFKERNIVVQPGPVTAPPEARSLDTPSFRIIDFGRTECYDKYREEILYDWQMDGKEDHEVDPEHDARIEMSWGEHLMKERWSGRKELRFGKYEEL